MVLSIADVLNQWQSAGIFDYVLPFLLIFAVVYAVLSGTNVLGKNKGVHVIIALVVGLLSMQLGFVQEFFREIFPRAAVGIAVIIVFVILVMAFVPATHMTGWMIGFYCLGGVIALIATFNAFSALSWFGSDWWYEWGAWIIGALLIIGVIIAVAVPERSEGKASKAPLNS
jgi:hypothetical protein